MGTSKRVAAGVAVVLALGALAASGLAGGGGTDVSSYKVGKHPIDVAVGDFDRDGRKDLAVTNFEGNPTSVSILLGRAHGRFAPQRKIRLPGDQPDGIAVARIGNGKDQELIVGGLGDDLLIFKGRRGARFAKPKRISLGFWPRQVATGDFDHDDLTDLAVSRQQSNDVVVLLGAGGLQFGPALPYAGSGGGPILAARLDPGNDLDLLTPDFDVDGLTLLRGNPNGTFDPAETLFSGNEPSSIAAVDLDGDGRRDIIVGLFGPAPQLQVARGEAGGTFDTPETLTVGSGPMMVQDIAVTRLNRDDDPDLVIAGRRLSDVRIGPGRRGDPGPPVRSRVIFLKGRPGIGLKRVREITFRGESDAVAAARFDRGGSLDAAVTRFRGLDNRGRAVVILNP